MSESDCFSSEICHAWEEKDVGSFVVKLTCLGVNVLPLKFLLALTIIFSWGAILMPCRGTVGEMVAHMTASDSAVEIIGMCVSLFWLGL